jgi:hypothetical protein
MNIVDATRDYEGWLAKAIGLPLEPRDLDFKHLRMADADDPFPFFRGTYYRWAQNWATNAGLLANAPHVLAIGDLHVENYGTWRDADGRLCWGVNDFDEADELPYANDLVRLAVSVRFAKKSGVLDIGFDDGCAAILDGYRKCLVDGGRPFVLEEHHAGLRKLAMSAEREPVEFWSKLTKLLADPEPSVPGTAREALLGALPAPGLACQIRARPRAGMGSLGRPRYIALAEWASGWIAREAKASAPPASAWAAGADTRPRIADAVAGAVRSPDPFYRLVGGWIVRRLAPRCSRIELGELVTADVRQLLAAMGAEAANVHLGTPDISPAILSDMDRRPEGWLQEAARAMCEFLEKDWQDWRSSIRKA